jgi:arabinofuranosyltransferase
MLNPPVYSKLRERKTMILAIGAIALLTLLIRTGWASEDAYISYRVVDNFLGGYGLTWNLGERVQVYTDPLYVFLTIAVTWLTGSAYWSATIVSLLLTMAAYFVLMYKRDGSAIVIGTAILLSSRAFMDFSVSGLENPATHLGIAAFCYAYLKKRDPLILTLIASLTAVNRLDSILLFLPALLVTYYREGWKVWKPFLLGITPLAAWEAFSVFYYGFPFPNTAYAKLGMGISASDLMSQGVRYLLNACRCDKVTAAVIVAGIAVGVWFEEWPLTLGLLSSIAYVVRVGGDYMTGRFLSAPLCLAVAIIVAYTKLGWKISLGLTGAVLALGLLNPQPSILTTTHYGIGVGGPVVDGISDERLGYYKTSGILRWRKDLLWPDYPWSELGEQIRKSGERVHVIMPAGIVPYHAGPKVHMIDQGALGDALLARLHAIPGETRPGHYFRDVPDGYVETISTGINQIKDPKLAEYYNHLHEVISGDLWSVHRMQEIIAINLGKYNSLLPH